MEEKDSILEDIDTEEVEASYIQRLLTILTDIVMEISLVIAVYIIFPKELLFNLLDVNPYMRYLIPLFIIFMYRVICITFFGKTIGMLICRVKYLNSNLKPLSAKEKFIAIIATKTSNVKFFKK